MNRYIQKDPGPICDDHGRRVGEHVGLSFYTLGQRQGLGIGGVKTTTATTAANAEHQPWFVARKDLPRNTLWAVQGHDHPWLLSPTLQASDVSWVAGHAPTAVTGSSDTSDSRSIHIAAKTRYRQADAPCTLSAWADGFTLQFEQAQWAVTPGQSAVLYDGEVCLGGGVIHHCSALDQALPTPVAPPRKRSRSKAASMDAQVSVRR